MADAKKVIWAIKSQLGVHEALGTSHSYNAIVLGDALSVIEEQQTEIERLQPKKGHWEMKPDPFGLFDEIPVCSVCGCTNDMRKKTAFCEYCGADMREGDGG